jgi:hypothetical protein
MENPVVVPTRSNPQLFHTDEEILAACRQVLVENGLHEWRGKINKRLRRLQGCANCMDKTISLMSYDFKDFAAGGVNRSMVMDLIYHEVAHALRPLERNLSVPMVQRGFRTPDSYFPRFICKPGWKARHDHNIKWARIAVSLGCKPEFASTRAQNVAYFYREPSQHALLWPEVHWYSRFL